MYLDPQIPPRIIKAPINHTIDIFKKGENHEHTII